MQKLTIYLIEMVLLGFTAALTLANPLVQAVEYGVKKGWFKTNRP